MIDFLQNNWGKLSGLAVAVAHFIILHKQTIADAFNYCADHGGIVGVIKALLTGKPATLPIETMIANATAALAKPTPISPDIRPVETQKTNEPAAGTTVSPTSPANQTP